uniref:Uncharacterized protein n=1 Tax=Paramoeba aestuarina TaxID=180227 RepID=A0A7S4P1M1_9EUKA|mmetsp:Transcript_34768/g.54219  ORF Transcript_34768/g.54219 Transcript_34768/m.54219 type:complete len:101 (+) Transcript_34768:56-358(+)
MVAPGGYLAIIDFENRNEEMKEFLADEVERMKRGVFHPKGFSEGALTKLIETEGSGLVVERFDRFYITKKYLFSGGNREVKKEEEDEELVIIGCIARKKK